ncbi:MAG: hypothetical protein AUJ02_09220 [Chloroflexi bacterium 13_1_40CM_3_65_12]|nr:MAG: hypothetical protein AUH69_04935 [Actinobacteria bacterium 13_1_40CM_4_65_12]OLD24032.1 MAG: hypothetical protein AUJ02_09220 [Chloroflexi bacterium 13_1_40CM_3_65_12]
MRKAPKGSSGHMDRRNFIKTAGAGALGVASLSWLAAAKDVFAASGNQHVYVFVSFSQVPAAINGVLHRVGMQGAGTFDPAARWVKGGGSFVHFDQNASFPKPLIATGFWEPTAFVSYDTRGLGSYGTIQPGILTMKIDLQPIGSAVHHDVTFELVCNVGAVPLLTGEEEGWNMEVPGFATFHPLKSPLGITHLSIGGVAIDRGA